MSTPQGSPERPALPSFPDADSCLPAGSPVLSPDSTYHDTVLYSTYHDAVLSAAATSPSDSENLSPEELELLAKLEEQNR